MRRLDEHAAGLVEVVSSDVVSTGCRVQIDVHEMHSIRLLDVQATLTAKD